MRATNWQSKQVILGLLALGCILVDAGVVMALSGAVQWLTDTTSPLILACLAAIVIVAVRVCWTLRIWVTPVHSVAATLYRLTSETMPRARAASQNRCNR